MKRETAWTLTALVAFAGVLLAWLSMSPPTPRSDAVGAPQENAAQVPHAAPSDAAGSPSLPHDATHAQRRSSGEPSKPSGLRAHEREPIATPEPSPPPGAANTQSAATRVTPDQALREVQALVDKGTIGAARALAERYLRELPDGPEARQIMSLTGVHPHP